MSQQNNVKRPTGTFTPTTSFIYPIRTLLSGIQKPSNARDGVTNSNSSSSAVESEQNVSQSVAEGHEAVQDVIGGDTEVATDASTSRPLGDDTATSSQSYPRRRRKHRTTNFRDFPEDEDPHQPRTFITNSRLTSMDEVEPPTVQALFASGPVGEPVMYNPNDLASPREDDPRHPPNVSEAALEAFADTTDASSLDPTVIVDETQQQIPPPTNFSQSGIVHLGPVPDSGVRSSSAGSGPRSRPRRESGSLSRSPAAPGVAEGIEPSGTSQFSTRPESISSDSVSRSRSGHGTFSVSGQSTSASSEGPRITFRYQHMEDEEGHHLILGREGKLTNCEDEPIRTPGAVQGFGVLIALEEDYDTGKLSVRQVSENSTELLGLSPSYLFALDCFTQIFTDNQADLLLDNIQYLSDAVLTPEEQAENLHVFMLDGHGEPGSALPEEPTLDPMRRRSWVCWVAAHRPQMTAPANLDAESSTPASREQNLIVLEFELERDPFNPLYPPPPADDSFRSGISSPSDASGSTSASASSNTNSSGRTLVSNSSEEHIYVTTPDSSSASVNESDPSTANSTNVIPSIMSPSPSSHESSSAHEVPGPEDWAPSPEDVLQSTTTRSKPLLALERLRRTRRLAGDHMAPSSPASFNSGIDRGEANIRRGGIAGRRRRGTGAVGMMDVFAVMAQINEQFGAATDLESFMNIVVGVIKDLTQFHRVLVYQFDEAWNGKVVAELVDWNQTHDLYRGLHFPAADIPAQARHLYALNKVRLLYDRGQPTARLIVRSKRDLETPLDMTHCYLRAMSPIHVKYLGNMGVRASMSVSIVAFGQLWGLVACHSYGPHGMRVSFPVRQMLRLLSQSISRSVERLCYAQRLHTRKLINTMPTDQHPSGYIVSDADDLLGLFDADFGVLVIGEGAKILGPNQHGQEILIVAEYLRLRQFNTMQVSQAVTVDYPDLKLTTGLEVIAGLLYVPLSVGGSDFIAFLRKGQPTQVKWAGRPSKEGEGYNRLEPRSSFKSWSETVAGRCRAWSDEHLETAGVLALVYGKFIEVWRQKESALQTTKLTNILLANASHEVRTPLNHIINYLELALNSQLDLETRENLSQSHEASKSLLFTINDLLDLTRLESGNETSFNEPFDLRNIVREATVIYRNEAARRGLVFDLDLTRCPRKVVGDAKKIRTIVANLTANSLKYTQEGRIAVQCQSFDEPAGLRSAGHTAVEIIVSDTGCGISSDKLESIFREFEQVEVASTPSTPQHQLEGLGLGLAVVARIVEQLGGQLRVDSKVNEGSRFSLLIPFTLGSDSGSNSSSSQRSRTTSLDRNREIDSLVHALHSQAAAMSTSRSRPSSSRPRTPLRVEDKGEHVSLAIEAPRSANDPLPTKKSSRSRMRSGGHHDSSTVPQLRILIVEDNDINRTILAKRLTLEGHIVVNTTNGQEGLETVEMDRNFDCVLMDIQMPLLNGYEATERIRMLEQDTKTPSERLSHKLNGRIPIFAVSASLFEVQHEDMYTLGMDGWILKPIDFKRLRVILRGVTDPEQRHKDVYRVGCNWESGGWLAPAHHPTDNVDA